MTKPNGHDDPNIASFPTKEEREVLKKARIAHRPPSPVREPLLNLPPVVKNLCLLNIGVFLMEKFLPQVLTPEIVYQAAFVPARYLGDLPAGFAGFFSPVTHMFLHGGWLHLAINLGMLMAFGAGLEKDLGARRMLLLYFASGLCGALLHAIAYPQAEAPMIGASGAISGLFGGVLMMMHSHGMLGDPQGGSGYRKLLPLVLIWIGISVFFGAFGMPGVDNPIAWTTHIGGFIGGLLLYKPVRRLRLRA